MSYPEQVRRHLGPRLVLTTGIILGLVFLYYEVVLGPNRVGINFRVFYHAAEIARAGENFYLVSPPALSEFYRYRYPPITVVAFYPYTIFTTWEAGYVAHTALTVTVGIALALVLADVVEAQWISLTGVDKALIAAYVVASFHSMPSVVFGQVNHHIALGLALGLVAVERDRQSVSGILLAAASVVKIFPVLIGVWLLRRNAGKAIIAAVATSIGLVAASAAVFGVDMHVVYIEEALLPREASAAFVGGVNPGADFLTVRRPLSILLPSVDAAVLTAAAFLTLIPIVAYLYTDISTSTDRLVAIFGTIAAILVFFPSYPIYFVLLYFPLVPLLYVLERNPERLLFLTGAFVANFSFRLTDVERMVELAPVADWIALAILKVATPLFTVASVPLYGIALMLAGCLLYRFREN